MPKKTENAVLFVGQRAGQLWSTFKELEMCSPQFKSVYYHGFDPLNEIHGSVFYNGEEVLCNVEYEKAELKSQLIDYFLEGVQAKRILVIGDPSEWMYQAFTEAIHTNGNLNPSATQSENVHHVWFYPMGMITSDVRKEISNLVYELKKNTSNVTLLRKTDAELVGFLPKLIQAFEANSLHSFVSQNEGLEQVVGKTKEDLQLG